MAITQPIGNVRVMPQAPETGDPLAGMKAFAIGTQLGQELAGLSLASEKLKFEKAQMKAKEQGLKWEQLLAQYKLRQAEMDMAAQPEKMRLEREKLAADAEASRLSAEQTKVATERARFELDELRGYNTPAGGASAAVAETLGLTGADAAPLAGAVVSPGATPEAAPLAPAAARPALNLNLAELEAEAAAKNAPKAQTFEYQPDFSKNPTLDPTVRYNAADPRAAAMAAEQTRQMAERDALVRQALVVDQQRSTADRNREVLRLQMKAVELGSEQALRKPKTSTHKVVDSNGIPLEYQVWTTSDGEVAGIAGPAKIDVKTLHENDAGQKKYDETYSAAKAERDIAPPKRQENIEILQHVVAELEDPANTTTSGFFVGSLPEFVRARFMDRQFATLQEVQTVVSASLREILGGQFAMKEGEQLLARAFDVRLDERENLVRAQRLLATLTAQAEAIVAQDTYFEKNKTMAGYRGPKAAEIRKSYAELLPSGSVPTGTAPRGSKRSDALDAARRKVVEDFKARFAPSR